MSTIAIAKIYTTLIIKKIKVFSAIPNILKNQVRLNLIEKGLYNLIDENN